MFVINCLNKNIIVFYSNLACASIASPKFFLFKALMISMSNLNHWTFPSTCLP